MGDSKNDSDRGRELENKREREIERKMQRKEVAEEEETTTRLVVGRKY
jgi:hypothetical protein